MSGVVSVCHNLQTRYVDIMNLQGLSPSYHWVGMWRICSQAVDQSLDQHAWGVNWHSTWKGSVKDFGRITSDNADPGEGGSIDTQLGKDLRRLWKDCLWQCWSWGGGSLNTQLGKDLQRLWKDYLWQYWSWGVGVTQHSTWKGSAKTLEGSPLTMLIWGGGQLTLNLERIYKDFGRIASDNADPGGVTQHSTWKGSTKTLEGSPLTMLILGGSIDTQLGKDPQRLWKDRLWQCWSWGGWSTLNLERICKDFGRITSDNVDPGGVNRHSTWKGSAKTLEGSPLTMLILGGGVIWHSTWKGSMKTLEGSSLTILIGGVIDDTQLGKDPQRLWKDCLWQCWSWRGVDRHSTWKGSTKTLEGSPLTMLILGGSIDTQLGNDLHWKDYIKQCWSGGESWLMVNLESWPKSTHILSMVTVGWNPPRINIGRGNPDKVFVDPFQVNCWWHPPRINTVRGNPSKLLKSLQILFKLTID